MAPSVLRNIQSDSKSFSWFAFIGDGNPDTLYIYLKERKYNEAEEDYTVRNLTNFIAPVAKYH